VFSNLLVFLLQILLDVVSVFKMVSSLAQKKQSVKISQEGIEVGTCVGAMDSSGYLFYFFSLFRCLFAYEFLFLFSYLNFFFLS